MPQKKKRTARKGNGRRSLNQNGTSNRRVDMPRILVNPSTSFVSPRFRTKLRWNGSGIQLFAGQSRTNSRICPTNAYDIDTAVGSTSMPGFAELAALYRYYRVLSFRMTVQFVNKEAFPVEVYICPLNYDPGANIATQQALLSSTWCRKKVLGGSTGNSSCRLSQTVRISDFAGFGATMADSFYVGRTDGSSAPPNEVYEATGVQTDGSNMLNGVFSTTDLEIVIDFFEITTPLV